MNKWIKTLIGCVFVVILTACSVPIRDVQTPVFEHSIAQIERAIMEGGRDRKWIMKRIQPGVISANLINREHKVEVRINYSADGYQINYVSSQNMYEENGLIHKKYFGWVNNLDRSIQSRLRKS
jgi:hypothetical protein